MTSSNELRQAFLDYFRDRGHEVAPSSSLVPGNDPTLLFTNSGMVQFKDVFLGADQRSYRRAVTAQRCVRAGGKHNDLENVGYTARHHTFFEMLGNFSFGDYFKREAIAFAWEFLTREMGLAREKMWITVFEDDDEAAEIWRRDVGVASERIVRCGEKDNFWSMGDIGPCGPCSEVFYDHGPKVAGGPPGSPDQDGDRFVEIWNLVFMQFNRDADGAMHRLPKPSVDTGMGLERAAAVLQGVHDNYEIDLFRNLTRRVAELTASGPDPSDKSLRVIADHIRSCAFLVVDGVVPANEGRGYVLRRIVRRAIRHGHRLGMREPFFHRLVADLEAEMGAAYPELGERREAVERVLRQEEERFAATLDQGMRMFEEATASLRRGGVVPGEVVFRLYDTFGFPEDLVADVARERGLAVDREGFEREMAAQRERARSGSRFGAKTDRRNALPGESEFAGYDRLRAQAEVIGLYVDDRPVPALEPEDRGVVVLERTPFYPEGGGQVGDRGVLRKAGGCFEVSDTRASANAIAHYGVATEGELRVGDRIEAAVDAAARRATARNHSATHLLHAALRRVLGPHVQQRGSLVAPDRLRFDFSHFEPVGAQARQEVERLVNAWILDNHEVDARTMGRNEALERGAVAFFGEKYDAQVRVLAIGDVSLELCGGTHVGRSGDVGLFKMVAETGVAAGVRRVEAVTGEGALAWVDALQEREARVAVLLKSDAEGVEGRVAQLLDRGRELEREVEALRARLAAQEGNDLLEQAVEVDGLTVLAARCEAAGPKALREMLDRTRSRLDRGLVVLGSVDGEKVTLVAGVSRDLTHRVQAGPLVNFVAGQVGGKGGGRPDMAQAGGNDPSKLDPALASVAGWVRERLAVSA